MTIRAEASLQSAPDIEPAEIRVHVFSDVPLEISSMMVRDRFSNLIYQVGMPDCLNEFDARIRVSRRLLGVQVSATACGTGAVVDLGWFLSPPPEVRPCDASDTAPTSQACTDAQAQVTRLANSIRLRICRDLAQIERDIDSVRTDVTFMLAAAAFLLVTGVVAAIFFGPYGVIVGLVAVLFAAFLAFVSTVTGVRLLVLLNERSLLHRELSTAQTAFADAAADVRRLCCPHEVRVSLETPGC